MIHHDNCLCYSCSPHPGTKAATMKSKGVSYCAQCMMNGSGRFRIRPDGNCPNPDCVMYVRGYKQRPEGLAASRKDALATERLGPIDALHDAGILHTLFGCAEGWVSCKLADVEQALSARIAAGRRKEDSDG